MPFETGPFDDLREMLLRGGIAPRRVRRTLGELTDHLDALTLDQHALGYDGEDARLRARAFLGSDEELAAPWLADPRLKSLTARAPWAVFGLLVPVAVAGAYVLPTLFLVGLANVNDFVGHGGINAPQWYRGLAQAVTWAANLSLPLLLGIGLTLLAHRRRVSPLWPLMGAGLVAAIAMQMHVTFPAPGHHGGELNLGALLWWSHLQGVHDPNLPLMLAQAVLAVMPVLLLPFALRPRYRPT